MATKKLTNTERVKKNSETFRGRMMVLVKGAKASAKDKGYEFSICRDDLIEIWDNQNGLCCYTNRKMDTITHSSNLVSIDRRDSTVGYVKSNIQLCCWQANRAKSTMSNLEFISLCNDVTKARCR